MGLNPGLAPSSLLGIGPGVEPLFVLGWDPGLEPLSLQNGIIPARFGMGRERLDLVEPLLTSISLPSCKGKDFNWTICRIDLLLNYFVDGSEYFKHILQEAVDAHGPVLTLITYSDEMTPGDAFSPDNQRKSWCIYVGILEFGAGVLCHEEAWLPLAICRSSKVAKVKGGLPCLFRQLLRSWFVDLKLSDGVLLNLRGPTVVSFHETMFIKDLDGYRAGYGWRGSSSLRPCFKCRNCMMKGHHSVSPTSWQVDITETRDAKFDLATDADLFEIVDLIEAARTDPAIRVRDCEDLEKAHGFNHIENGHVWMYVCMCLRDANNEHYI